MDLSFIITIILISLSGVIAPGPLFAVTIAESKRNKFAGTFIALGHAALEIPLILFLFFFGAMIITKSVEAIMGVLGGLVLLYFAYSEYKSISVTTVRRFTGLIAGFAMSTLNPYFIVWWLTVGFKLIIDSLNYGFLGLLTFITVHELCDFVWLTFVSLSAYKMYELWSEKALKVLSTVSLTIFAIFGVKFLLSGIIDLKNLFI